MARATAQKGLDNCLATKARLKAAVEECHKRRDSAREKLKACLDRKVVLKAKIKDCHEKRDDARKKLEECLTRKKELKSKIEAAKAKITGSSSLIELRQQESDVEVDLEKVMLLLKALNKKFDSGAKELKEVGAKFARIVRELQNSSKEEEEIRGEMAEVDASGEGSIAEETAELQKDTQDSLDSVKQIDRESAAAVSAAET